MRELKNEELVEVSGGEDCWRLTTTVGGKLTEVRNTGDCGHGGSTSFGGGGGFGGGVACLPSALVSQI